MDNLINKDVIKHNISILENLTVGEKLYVNPETLELSVDDRNFQSWRRRENRHECLIPILLTLWGTESTDKLESLKETYCKDFTQLDHLEKLIDYVLNKKIKNSKENLIKSQKDNSKSVQVDNFKEKIEELEVKVKEMGQHKSGLELDIYDKDRIIIEQEKTIEKLQKAKKGKGKGVKEMSFPGDGYGRVYKCV